MPFWVNIPQFEAINAKFGQCIYLLCTEEVDMTKYVMHIENDHSFEGIVGISLLEKENELIAEMKKIEAEDDVRWNTPLKRLEFEMNEEGYTIVDEKNMTFPDEPCPDGRGHGKSFM